jgi:membrane protease YdiL (CAAX protease family)
MNSMAENSVRRAGATRGFWFRFLAPLVTLGALLIGGELAIDRIGAPAASRPALMLGLGLLLSMAMVAAYRFLVSWLEQRSPRELSAQGAYSNVGLGSVIGLGLFAGTYLILWCLGALTIESIGDFSHFTVALTIAITSAVGEEILLRGVVFRLVEEKVGTFCALAVSAIVFGALHFTNPGASVTSAIAIALEAGVLLALAFTLTRNLWLPIGIHFGWNLAEGGIFGAAVSGNKSHGIIHATLSGPDFLTGGAFGPEQSIVAAVVSIVASIVFLLLAIKARRIVPFAWSTRRA